MAGANRPLRILVVENEPLIVQVIRDIVDDAGWELVGPAFTLQQAVALASNVDCDCAVLDIHLDDGVTSLPVAAILVKRGIPFLFATSLGFPGQVPGFEGVPVLRKPFRYRSFTGAVQNIQA